MESVTSTVKLEVAPETVPEISPLVLSRLRPEGKAPLETDQVSGGTPPELSSIK